MYDYTMQPSQMDYSETYPTLDPDSYNINTSSVPVNGSTFSTGQIYVDLLKQDFLIPDSLTIRYTMNVVCGTNAGFVCGAPVFTPLLPFGSAGERSIFGIYSSIQFIATYGE